MMKITQGKSNCDAPKYPDECVDCGSWMNSKFIGKDRLARCVACHGKMIQK